MARADRRRVKRVAAKALRRAIRAGGDGVEHPVPASVTLSGGPMNGWVVKPDAPALQRDWCLTWPPTIAEKNKPGFYVADGPGRARWEQL